MESLKLSDWDNSAKGKRKFDRKLICGTGHLWPGTSNDALGDCLGDSKILAMTKSFRIKLLSGKYGAVRED